MPVNSRWQALKLCLDAPVVVVIQVGDEFLLEVFHRDEGLKIEQFALEQSEEIFNHSIIQAVAFSAHAHVCAFSGVSVLREGSVEKTQSPVAPRFCYVSRRILIRRCKG